ncbi:lipoprotein [Spiroplasma sp. SV19]|uniref:lipoprotein n=1 Tax=Spiroplasma sp. SV19 TaxID=2570468 RepID=UPI0024B79BFA|nr:lipoprotein [Spiroplasma sp. SV19]WHQ37293.1 hypothetical protein E7Y35_05365 [Spiroplasma sp. SV19]
MKRLLSILGVLGLTATGTTTVVACNKNEKAKSQYNLIDQKVIDAINKVLTSATDVKDVKKDQTYETFFNMDGSNEQNFLQKNFYTKLETELESLATAEIMAQVLAWSHQAASLVLLDNDHKQIKEFSSDNKAEKLEDLYLNGIKEKLTNGQNPDADWFRNNPRVTLAVKVAKESEGVKLSQDGYLTFTFAQN